MLAFNHILSGSIVGLIVPAPFVPLVAFVSHYLLDLMPHAYGEEPPYTRFLKIQIAVDAVVSLLAIVLVVWLFPTRWPLAALGAFFGFLPDALWVFWRKGGPRWFQKFLDWAHWIQWGERPYGWIFDAFYAFAFSFTLFALAGKV